MYFGQSHKIHNESMDHVILWRLQRYRSLELQEVYDSPNSFRMCISSADILVSESAAPRTVLDARFAWFALNEHLRLTLIIACLGLTLKVRTHHRAKIIFNPRF